ncbi:MAG: glutamine--fructose-6-phosphate transaminase (isomerizing) [candidate division NC10 bacterium]|nr:glutamine--fructose-6-phosphate transaminase (isomerizing) [candidate division NC10 bacterium]
MCGIIGYVGPKKAVPVLLDGLKRLEYRGYDSAGVAFLQQGALQIYRSVGKIKDLENTLWGKDLAGDIGVGHTRWATHGRPSEANAHPHVDCSGELVVVHNGIIENYVPLKEKLIAEGHRFTSETDTEVIAHLVEHYLEGDLEAAVRRALREVAGAYAIAVLWQGDPDRLVVARCSSPLVVGIGEGEFLVASDIPALLSHTRNVLFLEDQELAVISREGVTVTTMEGEPVQRPATRISWSPVLVEKGGYKHFMLKEIHEQPRAIRETLLGRYSLEAGEIYLDGMEAVAETLPSLRRVVLVACGTSWHAALVGKFLLEELCQVPVEVDYSSEFRYRELVLGPDTLVLTISQSGETLDTLVALREAKRRGCRVVSIVNVVGSSIARESDGVCYTHAGPEIGVASTKAFTAQLTALYLLALYLGRHRGVLDSSRVQELLPPLLRLPQLAEETMRSDEVVERLSHLYSEHTDFLFLGRGINYPVALEGALKLKEVSYIHAEGYPAGEMKHGPIALIDARMPVVVLAPQDRTHPKILANIQEVKARGGVVIAVGTAGDPELRALVDHCISIPATTPHLTPILMVIPLQLLAYHIAVRKGCDVDQPRNLAKSVTVE